jgi:hypothetical protein
MLGPITPPPMIVILATFVNDIGSGGRTTNAERLDLN